MSTEESTPAAQATAVIERPSQSFDLSPRNFEQALQLADYLAKSEMVPKQYRGRPGDCLIAMQWGFEVGLKPLQALQSIAAINGKPNLYGDAGKALLLSHGCVIDEDDTEVVKANSRARCKITRAGRPPVQRTFSIEDAKTANLWGKDGPWRNYPWRQMAWRAFWFAARDAAADLLRGMDGFEEGLDLPTERHMGPVDEVKTGEAAQSTLPPYPEADFAKNLPEWTKVVESGRKTAPALLAMLSTKATFTDAQKASILKLGAQPGAQQSEQQPTQSAEHAAFVAEMQGAEGGAK